MRGDYTTYQHVQGSNPANTSYISTTDAAFTDTPKNYGVNQIRIDTQQLQRGLNAGKVPVTTEIVTPQQLQIELNSKAAEVQAKFEANSSPKNKDALDRASQALENATRDGECLIKGCVPAPYIQWPNGSLPTVPSVQPEPPVTPVQ